MLDEPSAKHRADGGRNGGETGPGPDGAAPFLFGEGDADQGEAARYEERSTGSLERTGGDKLADGGGNTAPSRGEGKHRRSDRKDFPPAVEIAERSAGKDQSG